MSKPGYRPLPIEPQVWTLIRRLADQYGLSCQETANAVLAVALETWERDGRQPLEEFLRRLRSEPEYIGPAVNARLTELKQEGRRKRRRTRVQ